LFSKIISQGTPAERWGSPHLGSARKKAAKGVPALR
jgi:hypothetical protein